MRDHGRAALFNGGEALLGRELLFEDVRRILHLAAAGAGQVAAEERLEHQHKRIALVAGEALLEHVSWQPSTSERLEQPYLGKTSGAIRRGNGPQEPVKFTLQRALIAARSLRYAVRSIARLYVVRASSGK